MNIWCVSQSRKIIFNSTNHPCFCNFSSKRGVLRRIHNAIARLIFDTICCLLKTTDDNGTIIIRFLYREFVRYLLETNSLQIVYVYLLEPDLDLMLNMVTLSLHLCQTYEYMHTWNKIYAKQIIQYTLKILLILIIN